MRPLTVCMYGASIKILLIDCVSSTWSDMLDIICSAASVMSLIVRELRSRLLGKAGIDIDTFGRIGSDGHTIGSGTGSGLW
jgi:hypothetical protein